MDVVTLPSRIVPLTRPENLFINSFMNCLLLIEMKFVVIIHYTTGVAHTSDLFGLRVSRLRYELIAISPATACITSYTTERCRVYLNTPPDEDWEGVFEQVIK